jgi:hypothetical protein
MPCLLSVVVSDILEYLFAMGVSTFLNCARSLFQPMGKMLQRFEVYALIGNLLMLQHYVLLLLVLMTYIACAWFHVQCVASCDPFFNV